MREFFVAPEIHSFSTFGDFAKEFTVGKGDLILTNECIYDLYMKKLNLDCKYVFQEKYGDGEPTDVMVDEILTVANEADYKRIIAVGGGTILDISKFLRVANCENIDQMYDKMVNSVAQLDSAREYIAVPTTCGTGSEVTNIAVANRTRMGTKLGLVSPTLFADYAVLIPEFLDQLPYYVFASSSIDALIHAVESYLSPNASSYSELFSLEAITDILKGYCKIAANGQDARKEDSEMYQRASNYAGIAFSNGGCALVHALSFSLGGKYHVPHGEANYEFFTDILDFYQKKNPDGKIKGLGELIYSILKKNGYKKAETETNGIVLLDALLNDILPKKRMSEYGATEADVEVWAEATIANQQRLLKNNYVSVTIDEIKDLYRSRL